MKTDELDIVIDPPSSEAIEDAKAVWKSICKPLGSLGRLEDLVIRLAGIAGTADVHIDKRCAVVVCGDNGVIEEGVTQSDADVTAAVAVEIAHGKSNINVMAHAVHADTFSVDVGVKADLDDPLVINRKIANGSANISKGPAMTRQQAIEGIQVGIDLVKMMKDKGYQIMITGEMGIGNTTTSSAIATVLLDQSVEEVTGRGAGLTSEGLNRKIDAIKRAIDINRPDKTDAIDILHKLGGYDIAAMTGLFLGGGIYHVPIIIDGLISSISALLAQMIEPMSQAYMFASHVTEEPAGILVLEKLQLQPLVYAQMRLGEGTGAVCLLPLMDIALAEYHEAHRFADTQVEQYVELK